MHSYFESRDLLQKLQTNLNSFSQIVETKQPHAILQTLRTIRTLAHDLLQGTAIHPDLQKSLFITFTKSSNLLQSQPLAWTEEEKEQHLPELLTQMIQEVKESLGLDITHSAITRDPSFIQPHVAPFVRQLKKANFSDEKLKFAEKAYIVTVLHKNLRHVLTRWNNPNIATIAYQPSDRNNENEYLISCMHIPKGHTTAQVITVYCYAHPATNTWSLSASDPGIYTFPFLEHQLIPLLRREYNNPHLTTVASDLQLTQQECFDLIKNIIE